MKELLDLVDQTGTTDSIAVEVDGKKTAVILLHTTGAKSGAERRTPVIRIERDGVYAIVASAGGADTNPSWYHNVKANPDVVVQDRTEISRFTAREPTIRIDHDRPEETAAGGQAINVYPCYPREVRLGNATACGASSVTGERPGHDGHGFDVLGEFAHSFFKPNNLTLDFVGMKLHIARGVS